MDNLLVIIPSAAAIITTLLNVIDHIFTRVYEIKERNKLKRDEVRKKIALQLIGFYYEEQVLISELSKLTGEPEITIKKRMRIEAQKHIENKEEVYPNMTANQARDYITN